MGLNWKKLQPLSYHFYEELSCNVFITKSTVQEKYTYQTCPYYMFNLSTCQWYILNWRFGLVKRYNTAWGTLLLDLTFRSGFFAAAYPSVRNEVSYYMAELLCLRWT